ncbi:MAG: alpha/beta hydrolase, partial [Eudoraea sp.]|nr:alpha/beta hydrolase [Eudoraea sp.]NNK31090.1 alpha/beta fold hydrolase [Flavobacteriaceae bacterium]
MKNTYLILLLSILFTLSIVAQQPTLPQSMEWLPDRPDVRGGSLKVPENHDTPEGKHIEIAYVVLKARDTVAPEYPMIFFFGGPGGDFLDINLVNFLLEQPMRERRDVILFDQRGIGHSSPLPNMSFESFNILAQDANEQEELTLTRGMISRFKEKCKEADIQPQYYNSYQNARDVGMLFKHLGYAKYNLLGGSYGTRLARIVQDLFPEYVHSAVLDSPAPLSGDFLLNRLDSYSLALERIFAYCQDNPECQSRYPNLKSDYFKAITKLQESPLTVSMNDSLSVVINAQDGIYFLRRLLYQDNSREKAPELIHAYLEGGGQVIREVLNFEYQLTGDLNLSMLLSVEKFENFNPENTAEVLEAQYENFPLIPVRLGFFDAFYRAGMDWHEANLPIEERQFKISDIPT